MNDIDETDDVDVIEPVPPSSSPAGSPEPEVEEVMNIPRKCTQPVTIEEVQGEDLPVPKAQKINSNQG